MLYYRTSSTVPDFESPPSKGVQASPEIVDTAEARRLIRWIEEHSPKTGGAKYVLRGALEIQTFRDFIWQHRGNWRPFYLPSFTRDFKASGTVAVGETTVSIDRNLSSYLASDRPDDYGRTVFFYTPARELHVARILASVAAGGGLYTLTLDTPFPFTADLSEAICGFAWLVRLSAKDVTWKMTAPNAAQTSLGFLEVRNTEAVEQEMTLTAIAHGANDGSRGFRTLFETDENPTRADMRAAATVGPLAYSQPQAANYTDEWAARLSNGVVTLFDARGGHVISEIFDGADATPHIAFAFDGLSNEALAWQKDFATIRLRWHSGGNVPSLEWEGRTPLLFNNFCLNGSLTAGEADVICYYVKTGESKLFARNLSEDFATEHVVSNLPVMPLGLLESQIGTQRHLIKAISTRHTLLTLQSDLYPAIFAIQGEDAEANASLAGEYFSVVVPHVETELASEGGHGGGPVAAFGRASLAGEYRNASVSLAVDGGGATGQAGITTGAYFPTAIDEDSPVDGAEGTAQVAGQHRFTAKVANPEESAEATATLSGTYSRPNEEDED